MQVAVWDTYVTKQNGTIMNFDIIVPQAEKDETRIINYGKAYLQSKSLLATELKVNRCVFCHVEQATPEMLAGIQTKGYFIVELRGCN